MDRFVEIASTTSLPSHIQRGLDFKAGQCWPNEVKALDDIERGGILDGEEAFRKLRILSAERRHAFREEV